MGEHFHHCTNCYHAVPCSKSCSILPDLSEGYDEASDTYQRAFGSHIVCKDCEREIDEQRRKDEISSLRAPTLPEFWCILIRALYHELVEYAYADPFATEIARDRRALMLLVNQLCNGASTQDRIIRERDEQLQRATSYLSACEKERNAALSEVASLRETVKRLNRRAQLAEAAALQNVEECRRQGMSLGRMLALWAHEHEQTEHKKTKAELGQAHAALKAVAAGKCLRQPPLLPPCGVMWPFGRAPRDPDWCAPCYARRVLAGEPAEIDRDGERISNAAEVKEG